MLASYSQQVWEGLLTFSEARRRGRDRLSALGEIGTVICRHGLQDLVGVALIHRHFKLGGGERLVEEFREGGFRIGPSAAGEVTPYLWKVEQTEANGDWRWYPIEFVRTAGAPTNAAELAARLSEEQRFLADLAATIVRLGVKDIFGLNTLHRDAVTAAPGEMLIETNDERTRVLDVAAYPVSAGTEEISPTYWRFEAADPAMLEPTLLQSTERRLAAGLEPTAGVFDLVALTFQKLLAPNFPRFYRRVALRCLAVREAVDLDLHSEPLEDLIDRFRQRRRLRSEAAFEAWLRPRGLTPEELGPSLRERDREARLIARYRERHPELRGRAHFYRRLVAELSSRAGVRPADLLANSWHRSWDSSLIRELKWRGKFLAARETAAGILRSNAELFSQQRWLLPLLTEERLEAYLADRCDVPVGRLRAVAHQRGFARYEDLLEAARFVFVHDRRSGVGAAAAAV